MLERQTSSTFQCALHVHDLRKHSFCYQKDVRPKKEASQVNEEELDANEFFKLRSAAVASLKEKGEHPYPHKFHVSMSLENFIQDFQHLEPGEVGFLSLGVFSNVRKHLR